MAIFGLIAVASAQESVELECTFGVTLFGEYFCLIVNAELTDRDAIVTITGNHTGDRTNDDVDILAVFDSDMRFIPEILYTTFPNINEIDFEFAGIEELDQIPELPNLAYFILDGNNITTIRNNTFVNVGETMFFLEMVFNNHQELEVDAFAGLAHVQSLYLLLNNIALPPQGIFDPLTSLRLIDFDSNNFGIIDDDLFAENTQLRTIFGERNGIDRISPNFAASFRDSLNALILFENECTDRAFFLQDDVVLAFMNMALQDCYNNFSGRQPNATRNVTFEYRGSLRLFDEFGNLILSAN